MTEIEDNSVKLAKFSLNSHDDDFINISKELRTELPAPMFEKNDLNVFSILKQCVGKELSKITMPILLNEPLTFLQRMTEYLEYYDLLIKASHSDDPIERLEYVTAFAVSATSSNWERTGKPFNPVLGETYELERNDLGFRIVCEQVSHHPPISAFHAEAEDFILHGSIQPRLKFWGKSIEINPKGVINLKLIKHDETYSWQNANCSVNNVICGKLWIEQSGTIEITNHKTKHHSHINFKSNDFMGRDLHKVEGYVCDPSNRKIKMLYGKWVEAVYSVDVKVYEAYLKTVRRSPSPFSMSKTISEDIPSRGSSANLNLQNQKLLWEVNIRPENSKLFYNFTNFSMSLNQLDSDMIGRLPPTDSRFRPDVRKMENGDIGGAAETKNEIEEKQRLFGKDRKRMKEDWKPKWFKSVKNATNVEEFVFTGKYWELDWSSCPNIFS